MAGNSIGSPGRRDIGLVRTIRTDREVVEDARRYAEACRGWNERNVGDYYARVAVLVGALADLAELAERQSGLPVGKEPRPGYCKHGVYVGGIGVDWMCGRCEDGQ